MSQNKNRHLCLYTSRLICLLAPLLGPLNGTAVSAEQQPVRVLRAAHQTPQTSNNSTQREGDRGSTFAGQWWQSSNSDERRGFLAGTDDCLTFDAHVGLLFSESWAEYEKKVSEFYVAETKNLNVPVADVYKTFGRRASLKLGTPHFKYSEEWWRGATKPARRGFVEGYITCRQRATKDSPSWSKNIDDYVNQLDDLYNYGDHKGFEAPEFAGAIAAALYKCRDRR